MLSHTDAEVVEYQQNIMQSLLQLSVLAHLQDKVLDGFELLICEYISLMSAYLALYDAPTNPMLNENIKAENPNDIWRYAIAMTSIHGWNDCIAPFISALIFTKQNPDRGVLEQKDTVEEKDNDEEKSLSDPSPDNIDIDIVCSMMRSIALGHVKDMQGVEDEDIGDLCNIEFSLAYGGKILLHNTRLKLSRGRRYGVMGKNGAGKTTLLRNIGAGTIEGLPTTIKTVYVQHDDITDDMGVPLLEELVSNKDIVAAGVTEQEAVAALKAIQFTDQMLAVPRSMLSGGWKMKLIIIRAMLLKPDVLLLDEVLF
jgi:ABC-type iron transport system FetAB ATPase subunit